MTPLAMAQSGYSSPYGSTISPWMNMFQKKSGPFDNYNSYVRPQMQLQNTLAQQNAAIQQQNANYHALGKQLMEVDRENPIPVTGTGSVFMSYSHYYSGKGGGGVGGRATTPSRVPVAASHMNVPTGSSLRASAARGR